MTNGERAALVALARSIDQGRTPDGYLSPEQSGRMNRSVDRRTDLYSLGVTFYELLVGHRPFESADPLEVLHATVARVPRAPAALRAEVPEVLSAIVMRLLAKDAEDRYQNAAALADDLERCAGQLRDGGTIEPFEIGTTDRRGSFSLTERLYGRRVAKATLEAALRRSMDGASVFIGICGPAGSGKTALSRELLPLLHQDGLLGQLHGVDLWVCVCGGGEGVGCGACCVHTCRW